MHPATLPPVVSVILAELSPPGNIPRGFRIGFCPIPPPAPARPFAIAAPLPPPDATNNLPPS